MTLTYNKPVIKFTVPSAYTVKPLVFCVRRKTKPSRKEIRAMKAEITILEDWARNQEDTITKKFRQSYTQRMRNAFGMILKGYQHVRCIEVTKWRVATRLNERGENDYRVVRETRQDHLEWR